MLHQLRPNPASRPTRAATVVGVAALVAVASVGSVAATAPPTDAAVPTTDLAIAGGSYFDHVGTFEVTGNLPDGDDPSSTATVAEIVAANADGTKLVYTDALTGSIGFVDIADPAAPAALGSIDVGGDPTSVAVVGDAALVAVNTSADYVDTSGVLHVVDLATTEIIATFDVAGQPDSVAVSPDQTLAVVVIENERDEDLDDGLLPQAPAGLLHIVDIPGGDPAAITGEFRDVELTGIAEYGADDPEPEFVDINDANQAVVTMQENNHLAIVDLASGTVVDSFTAGEVELDGFDGTDDGIIEFTETRSVRREPDAVAWIDDDSFATANEGDYVDADEVEGGSRGFTVFNVDGTVEFESGLSFENAVAAAGHYPEARSDAKGIEPEGVEFGVFDGRPLLFVGAERASVIGVYDVTDPAVPAFLQLLPAGAGPEGILALPERGLLAVSAEVDGLDEDPDDQFLVRPVVTLYALGAETPEYPQLSSVTDPAAAAGSDPAPPIPWGALSGLSADPADPTVVWAVSDSFFATPFLYRIDVSTTPATITERIAVDVEGAGDLEGVAARPDGGFWLVSEGDGEELANVLVQIDGTGALVGEPVALPAELDAVAGSNGFEGVTVGAAGSGSELVYVAVQRGWDDDADGTTKLGRYDVATGAWTFAAYPLDPVESPNGGWVGLSEITALPDGRLAIVERDNQLGGQARIKRLYAVDPATAEFATYGAELPVLDKWLLVDLLPVLTAEAVVTPDKLEGVAVAADGGVWIVTDNDGTDDSNGQTVFTHVAI